MRRKYTKEEMDRIEEVFEMIQKENNKYYTKDDWNEYSIYYACTDGQKAIHIGDVGDQTSAVVADWFDRYTSYETYLSKIGDDRMWCIRWYPLARSIKESYY